MRGKGRSGIKRPCISDDDVIHAEDGHAPKVTLNTAYDLRRVGRLAGLTRIKGFSYKFKTNITGADGICDFCGQGENKNGICGPLRIKGTTIDGDHIFFRAHHKCMQYSSGLTQYPRHYEDFGGFDVEEVVEELKIGRRITSKACEICGKKVINKVRTAATAGCARSKCLKTFHYPCVKQSLTAVSKRMMNKRTGEVLYRVFCSEVHYKWFTGKDKEGKRATPCTDSDSEDDQINPMSKSLIGKTPTSKHKGRGDGRDAESTTSRSLFSDSGNESVDDYVPVTNTSRPSVRHKIIFREEDSENAGEDNERCPAAGTNQSNDFSPSVRLRTILGESLNVRDEPSPPDVKCQNEAMPSSSVLIGTIKFEPTSTSTTVTSLARISSAENPEISCHFVGCSMRAAKYCRKCCNGYCDTHAQQHDRKLYGKGHMSVDINSVAFCTTHATYIAEDFCQTCSHLICDVCLMQGHEDHTITNAKEIREKLSNFGRTCEAFQGQLADLDNLLEYKTATRSRLNEIVDKITDSLHSFENHMCSKRDALLEQIQKDIDGINKAREVLFERKMLGTRAHGLARENDSIVFTDGISLLNKNLSTDSPSASGLVDGDEIDIIPKEWENLARTGIVKTLMSAQAGSPPSYSSVQGQTGRTTPNTVLPSSSASVSRERDCTRPIITPPSKKAKTDPFVCKNRYATNSQSSGSSENFPRWSPSVNQQARKKTWTKMSLAGKIARKIP